MAEVLASASAIAGLVSLAVQLSQISFGYISNVMGASKAQKSYLQELSALTSTLLQLQQAIDLPGTDQLVGLQNSALSKVAIDECINSLNLLKSKLEKKALKEGMNAKFSALTWPFDEKETKRVVESLHRYHSLFASAISADNL